ncbi:MAG: hypothetical protein J6A01_08730 [Proteobacteria bacterium]|nr:hypothetical protein [Pseudomonadota bacterium]
MEENEVQCAGDLIQTCIEGQWTDAAEPCEYGCYEGACFQSACGNLRLDDGEECDDELLGEKTCGDFIPMSTGELYCNTDCHIETSFCTLPVEDSPCDPASFIESCDGIYPVFCTLDEEENGVVVNGSVYCDDDEGMACLVFGSGTDAYAGCVHTTDDACSTLDEKIYRCDTTTDYQQKPFSLELVCSQANDGNLYYKPVSKEMCEAQTPSCLSETQQCGQLIEGEGTECPEDFIPSCAAGEIMVDCDYDDAQEKNVITAEACPSGQVCAVNNAGYPGCFEECMTEGETVIRCEAGYSRTYVCSSLGEQFVYLLDDYESCLHGCDTPDKTCLKLSEQEDQSCESDPFETKCDGTDVLLTCNTTYTIEATSCNNEYMSGYVCDNGKCVEPCETLEEIKYSCTYSDIVELHKYVCASSDTQMIWTEDITAVEVCESDICDESYGKCMSTCDAATFVPRCDGKLGMMCNGEHEYIFDDCEKDYCHVLDLNGDKWPTCLKAEEECPTPTDRTNYCTQIDGLYFEGYRSCRASDDGKNYYYDELLYECSGTCNAEGTACAD